LNIFLLSVQQTYMQHHTTSECSAVACGERQNLAWVIL